MFREVPRRKPMRRISRETAFRSKMGKLRGGVFCEFTGASVGTIEASAVRSNQGGERPPSAPAGDLRQAAASQVAASRIRRREGNQVCWRRSGTRLREHGPSAKTAAATIAQPIANIRATDRSVVPGVG